jgi:predicted phosphodiesterase
MRIAVLAGIHGNSLALNAVLQGIAAASGVDESWILGDLVAIGPDPLGVLECVSSLENVRFIRGNTDRYVTNGEMPWPLLEDAQKDPGLLGLHIHVARSFAWTTGALGASGWLPWLSRMPLERRQRLPDGTRVLAVHGAPGQDDGEGIHPETTAEQLLALLQGSCADLVLVGHTHAPFDREAGGVRVVTLAASAIPCRRTCEPATLFCRLNLAVTPLSSSGWTTTARQSSMPPGG